MYVYHGSCHCGHVEFEVRKESPIEVLIDCNCSVCTKKGLMHTPVENSEMNILKGEADLVLYQFGTMTAKYWFCPKCGVEPFHRSRGNPHRYSVNARCLDDYDKIIEEAGVWFIDAKQHPMDRNSDDFPLRQNPYVPAKGSKPDFVAPDSPEKISRGDTDA